MEVVTAALENKGVNLANTDPEIIATPKLRLPRARGRALQTRVKPGNPIHLRVVEDRGRTSEIDQLPVTVIASSGDSLGRILLKNRHTHGPV